MSDVEVTEDQAQLDAERRVEDLANENSRILAASELHDYQLELQRIARLSKELDKSRKNILVKAVPLQRLLGSTVIEGIDGKPYVASVIEAEVLKVDASELYEALVEHLGDGEEASMIWQDVLKPREVDTKDEGLFHQACKAERIPVEVIAKVARYEKRSAYIGFSKPGG